MEEDVKNMSKEELLEYLEDISKQLDNIALDQIQFAIAELQWWVANYKKENKELQYKYDKAMNDLVKTEKELNSVKEIYYTQAEVDTNYIPISVIQNKLEKLKREFDFYAGREHFEWQDGEFDGEQCDDIALKIGVLKELLEERNK